MMVERSKNVLFEDSTADTRVYSIRYFPTVTGLVEDCVLLQGDYERQ